MLPEVGALEYLIIAAVALIVVGPKDLPMLLRRLGQFVAKLRGMANEFRASFDEMARQSELDDLRKEVEAMRRGQFADMATQTEDLDSHARTVISDIEHSMADVGVHLNGPQMSYEFNEPAAAPPKIADAAPKKPRKPRAAAPETKAASPAPRKPRAKKAAEPAVATPPRKARAKKTVEAGT